MSNILQLKRGVMVEEIIPPGPRLPHGACFLFNRGGQGRIRFVGRESSGKDYASWLTVNGVPILSWQMKNSCPTCQQMLQSGNNAFDTGEVLSAIGAVDLNAGADSRDLFSAYHDLLSLFEDGLYFLSVSDYYPTDGQGNLFWGSYEESREATAVNYNYYFSSIPCPCFLVASQNTGKFSAERYKRAKERRRTSPGIVFHLGEYLSILLDGHHRALAAAEAGESFTCLTIASVSWYWADLKKTGLPTYVTGLFGCEMSPEDLSRPASRWLSRAQRAKAAHGQETIAGFKTSSSRPVLPTVFQQATSNLYRYPTVENVNAASQCPEVSDSDIEAAFTTSNAYPDLMTILNAFVVKNEDRARDVALRILRDRNWETAWICALRYLRRFDDKEVLALFWDLALESDNQHREVKHLVDSYIKLHADKYE